MHDVQQAPVCAQVVSNDSVHTVAAVERVRVARHGAVAEQEVPDASAEQGAAAVAVLGVVVVAVVVLLQAVWKQPVVRLMPTSSLPSV